MIKVETTTVCTFSSLEEANLALLKLKEQKYPTYDLYIDTICGTTKTTSSLELIAAIGGSLGLGLGILSQTSFHPSVLMLSVLFVVVIIGGTLIYQQLYRPKKKKGVTDYFLLKANSVEDAEAFKSVLGISDTPEFSH